MVVVSGPQSSSGGSRRASVVGGEQRFTSRVCRPRVLFQGAGREPARAGFLLPVAFELLEASSGPVTNAVGEYRIIVGSCYQSRLSSSKPRRVLLPVRWAT